MNIILEVIEFKVDVHTCGGRWEYRLSEVYRILVAPRRRVPNCCDDHTAAKGHTMVASGTMHGMV